MSRVVFPSAAANGVRIKSDGCHRKSRSIPKLSLPFLERSPTNFKLDNSIHVRSETIMKSETMPATVFACDQSLEDNMKKFSEDSIDSDEALSYDKRLHLSNIAI